MRECVYMWNSSSGGGNNRIIIVGFYKMTPNEGLGVYLSGKLLTKCALSECDP